MKTASSIRVAAIAGLVSVATAQSLCAVTCFQTVVTEHPPTECTEDNMYLCFCVSPSLQSYFIDCAYDECGSGAQEAINFGVSLCADLGEPITIPARPSTTTTEVAEPTSEPPVSTTEEASEPEPTNPVDESTSTTSVEEAEPTSETSSSTEEASAPEPTTDDETTAVSVPTETPVDESPIPEETSVSSVEPSVTPVPSGNSTIPPPTEPTTIPENMGNAVGASSMAIAAALGIAIVRMAI